MVIVISSVHKMGGWNLSTYAMKHPVELSVAILRTETSSMDTLSFHWAGIVFNFVIQTLVIINIFVLVRWSELGGIGEKVLENLFMIINLLYHPFGKPKLTVFLCTTDSSKFIKQLFNPFNCPTCYFDLYRIVRRNDRISMCILVAV